MRTPAVALVLAAFVANATAQQPELRVGESARETTDPFPGAEPRDANGEATVWCVRIVDAADRRPIAGALVQVPHHPEEGMPEAELHHQCVGRADADGWVRLPMAGVQGWRDYVFADAPGYAADEDCQPEEDECALQRGVDVPVQVVDYTGLPVPHARIELVLGCGHIPSQRTATTDARGFATLRDIQPSRHEDIFVTAPGVTIGGYRLRRTWQPGSPPVAIDVVPGIVVRGRVVDTEGQPVVGMRIGDANRARPWARTDRAGRFELVGVQRWNQIAYDPPPRLGVPAGTFTASPASIERTLVLGRQETTHPTEVRLRSGDDQPACEVRVVLVRTADGATFTASSDGNGIAVLSVPAGNYRAMAEGELGAWGRTAGDLVVQADKPTNLTLQVPRNPTVRVDATRVDGMTIGITTATEFRQLHWSLVHDKDVPVPVGERATFRISTWEGEELLVRHIEVPAPGSLVVLEGPPETRLRARFRDADGAECRGMLDVCRHIGHHLQHTPFGRGEGEEETTVATRLAGSVTWVAKSGNDRLAAVHGTIALPANGGEVDLGTIVFRQLREPDLVVTAPANTPVDGGTVAVTHVHSNGFVSSQIEADGSVWGGLGQATTGDRVTIRLPDDDQLPLHFAAEGPPPWRVTWPTGTLQIKLRSGGELRCAMRC